MLILLIGCSGAGKGKLIESIGKHYNDLICLSIAKLIKEVIDSGNDLSMRFNSYMKKGIPVPDVLMFQVLSASLKKALATKQNIILDSFPININQANWLDDFTKVDAVIYLDASLKESLKRLTCRRICPNCGRITNTRVDKIARVNVCKNCGKQLIIRADDNENAIVNKYRDFENQIQPILDLYEQKNILHKINANKKFKKVYKCLTNFLWDNNIYSHDEKEVMALKQKKKQGNNANNEENKPVAFSKDEIKKIKTIANKNATKKKNSKK